MMLTDDIFKETCSKFVYLPFFLLKIKVVQSSYLVEVNNEHVILGNAALLKCTIPSFVTDFVRVASWTITDSSGQVISSLDPDSSGIFFI